MQSKCQICGIEILDLTGRKKYCSRKCKTVAYQRKHTVTKVCAGCGKQFAVSESRKSKYCSLACSSKYAQIYKQLTCVDCGQTFLFKGRTKRNRCLRCHKKHRSMQVMLCRQRKDPNVQIGIGSGRVQTPNTYMYQDTQHVKALQRRRARYKSKDWSGQGTGLYRPKVITGNDSCAVCGYSTFQDALVVHHVDMDRKHNQTANLVVLCSNCHAVLHKRIRRDLSRHIPVDPALWFSRFKQEYVDSKRILAYQVA